MHEGEYDVKLFSFMYLYCGFVTWISIVDLVNYVKFTYMGRKSQNIQFFINYSFVCKKVIAALSR